MQQTFVFTFLLTFIMRTCKKDMKKWDMQKNNGFTAFSPANVSKMIVFKHVSFKNPYKTWLGIIVC